MLGNRKDLDVPLNELEQFVGVIDFLDSKNPMFEFKEHRCWWLKITSAAGWDFALFRNGVICYKYHEYESRKPLIDQTFSKRTEAEV